MRIEEEGRFEDPVKSVGRYLPKGPDCGQVGMNDLLGKQSK